MANGMCVAVFAMERTAKMAKWNEYYVCADGGPDASVWPASTRTLGQSDGLDDLNEIITSVKLRTLPCY